MKHIHVNLKDMPVRSRGLLLIGVIWFLIGLGTTIAPLPVIPDAWDQHLIPNELRTAIWWAASFGAIGAALDKQDGKRDWLALAFCVVPPMIRISSFLWAWIVYLLPGGNVGYERGWYSAAIYFSLVGIAWLVAAIPDVPAGKISLTPDQETSGEESEETGRE